MIAFRNVRIIIFALIFMDSGQVRVVEAQEIVTNIFMTIREVPIYWNLDLVFFIETGADEIQRQPQWSHRRDLPSNEISRNWDGTSISVQLRDIRLPSESRSLLVYGYASDAQTGDPLGYFPFILHVFPDSGAKDKTEITRDDITPNEDFGNAFTESFPFLSGNPANLGDRDTLVSAINSIRMIVANSKKDDRSSLIGIEEWSAIYNIIQTNTGLIANHSGDVLIWLLDTLQKYSTNSNDSGFPGFYLQFIAKLIRNSVDGIEFSNNLMIEDFLLKEQKNIFNRFTIAAIPYANESTDAFDDIRDYERCLDLSAFILKEFRFSLQRNSDIWNALDRDEVLQQIESFLLSATDCGLRLYAVVEMGDPRDVENATRFLMKQDVGRQFVEHYLTFWNALELNSMEINENNLEKYQLYFEQANN